MHRGYLTLARVFVIIGFSSTHGQLCPLGAKPMLHRFRIAEKKLGAMLVRSVVCYQEDLSDPMYLRRRVGIFTLVLGEDGSTLSMSSSLVLEGASFGNDLEAFFAELAEAREMGSADKQGFLELKNTAVKLDHPAMPRASAFYRFPVTDVDLMEIGQPEKEGKESWRQAVMALFVKDEYCAAPPVISGVPAAYRSPVMPYGTSGILMLV
jgi:hypothetical protein